MLSFFPRGVSDEILNLIESVSEGFPSYSCAILEITSGLSRHLRQMLQGIAQRYFNHFTVPIFLTRDLPLDATGAV